MRNRKQPAWPAVENEWAGLTGKALATAVLTYYREHLSGLTVRNEDTGIRIQLTMRPGGRKLSHGGSLYPSKADAVRMLPDLLRMGTRNNFGLPKPTDPAYVLGYLNLKAFGYVNDRLVTFRLAIQMRRDGSFYYNHEANRPKKKGT